MRNFMINIFSVSLGLLISATGLAATPATSWEDGLAGLNYAIGDEAPEIIDFKIKERVYLDSRHLVVPGGDSSAFLVTLEHDCHGLRSNRIIAYTETWHHLAPGDILAPTHQGRRVDECKVERIQALDAKQ